MALNPLDPIVRDLAEVKRQLAGRSQLNHSSLENTAIPVYDEDGQERLRIGAQDDGTHAIKYVQGPPPPRPTAPIVSVDGPVVRVRWDGILMGGHIPEDFARIDVHFALASEDLESPEAVRANLATSAGNETVLAATQTGRYRVGLVAMSQSRARSDMSDTVEVDVTLVDLAGALDAVVENASGGKNYYTPTMPPGTDHGENDLWFDTSVDEDGLTRYTPHRWDDTTQKWISLEDERVQAIQDAQAEFEQSTTVALSDVQQAAAGAQSAADAAQSTADTARSEAESKAAAAKAAAEAHAEAVAEAERMAAIAAASDDATAKADAAEAAAKAAAALDAKAKADAAQTAAEAKAATAQSAADAAMDRANAAHSAAGNAAGAAEAAMQAATHNAKNLWSTSDPSGTAPRGTIWFKIDPVTRNVVGQWQQTAGSDTAFGSNWERRSLTDALFDNIDAGKIGTGYLDVAKLIRAGAIQADKILVGGAGNLLTNPGFIGSGAGWNLSSYNPQITASGGPTGEPVLSIQHSDPNSAVFPYLGGLVQSVAGSFAPDLAAVEAGKRYSASVWVRADVDIPVGNAGMGFRLRELGSATLGWANPATATNRTVVPANTWAKVEGEFLVPATTGTWNRLAFGLRANGALNGRRVEFSAPVLLPMIGGTLIEPGAIRTPHLAAGSITGESGILARLDAGVITYGEMSGARLQAGTVDTEQLAFGAATGEILATDALHFKRGVGLDLVSSSFRAGDGVEITEEYGFRQFGPDGALNVDFPSDGSPASVRGDFSARRLSAQQLQLTGATTIASGADMVIESGVTAPTAAPQVTPYWDRVAMPPLADSESAAGLAWGDGHWWRLVTTTVGLSDGGRTRVEKISTSGELVGGFDCSFRVSANGLTILGHEIYVLAAGLSLSGDGSTPTKPRMVVVYNLAGVEQRRWEYTYYGTGKYQPGIGTNGTDVVIAQCWKTGELTYRRYSPTGTLVAQHDTPAMVGADMTGFVSGNLDYGGFRTVFAVARASQVGWQFLTYTGTGAALTYQRADSWTTPGYHAPTGLAWDGTHLWSLDPDGNLVRYARKTVSGFVGDHADDWWMAVSWRNDPAETLVGPAARFTYPHRAQLLVTVPDTPQGVSGIAFFVAKGESAPTRTQLHWAQEINHVAQTSILPSLASTWAMLRNPVGTSSFTDSEPGEIRSALSGFRVDGSGAGEWGPLRFGADGSLRGAGTVITGEVSHPSLAAGNLNSHDVTVTFPAGRFTSPPVIMLSHTNGLVAPVPSSGTVTKDSFQLRVWNPHETRNAGSGTVYWAAIERST